MVFVAKRALWALVIGALLHLGCAPEDPAQWTFTCAAQEECAADYFCSPVTGTCLLLTDDIPCDTGADCPNAPAHECSLAEGEGICVPAL